MKLPGWMASGETGFITATLQLGASVTAWAGPFACFTLRVLPLSAATLPRTTVGPAAGGCARAALATSAAVAAAAVIFQFIAILPGCYGLGGDGGALPPA